jgi:hypothetical protein
MTVDEGREVIYTVAVGIQGAAEWSRSGGQGESSRAKERCYGTCGKTGRNTRTCQIVVATSSEEYND